LIDRAALRAATAFGRTVKIALAVHDEAGRRSGTIAGSAKAMDHVFGPRAIGTHQLIHRATEEVAAIPGRSPDVSRAVEEQVARARIGAIVELRKIVEDGFGPRALNGLAESSRWPELEDHTPAVSTALRRCPVQGAIRAEDDPAPADWRRPAR
jgi:hypothetical protein